MSRDSKGYENQTQRPAVEWKPVMVPDPAYDSPQDKARHEEAVRSTPRRPGEDVCGWMDRVTAEVRALELGRLPYRDSPFEREPGQEG